MEDVLVTVICTAYNHEKYIESALNGFVCQKTNFKYEVLIHDDASTDHTADIIRKYQSQYPDIIYAVLQTENQYSKGIPFVRIYMLPKARGKYVALCEGDDYWTDETKLQRQVDFMESHPDCSLCTHGYCSVDASSGSVLWVRRCLPGDGYILPEQIIMNRDVPQTATFLFRMQDFTIPNVLLGFGVEDYPRRLYSMLRGRIYYIDRVMSHYRHASEGSWTSEIQTNKDNNTEHLGKMIQLTKAFDDLSGHKYEAYVEKRVDYLSALKYEAAREVIPLCKTSYFKKLSTTGKIKSIAHILLPALFSVLRRGKRKAMLSQSKSRQKGT